MPEMKLVVSDPESGKSLQVTIDEGRARTLHGQKIGDIVQGMSLGFPGYELKITGGSDRDGFPMRPEVHGGVRKYMLLSSPPGFKPKSAGERRRKRIRGNVITDETVQLNLKVVKAGKQSLEEILGGKLKEDV